MEEVKGYRTKGTVERKELKGQREQNKITGQKESIQTGQRVCAVKREQVKGYSIYV